MYLVDDYAITSREEIVVSKGTPRTILLGARGGGLAGVTRVLVNDVGVDDFSIVSDFEMLVRLPPLLDDASLANMGFIVYGAYATGRHRVRLIHAMTKRPRAVQGQQKLIQQVVRVLLSQVGTNKFDRSAGGNLALELDASLGEGRDPSVAVAQAADATGAFFKAHQRRSSLPANERLRALAFEGISYEDSQAVALLRVQDYSGAAYSFPVVL
jgi:hypothetical protein